MVEARAAARELRQGRGRHRIECVERRPWLRRKRRLERAALERQHPRRLTATATATTALTAAIAGVAAGSVAAAGRGVPRRRKLREGGGVPVAEEAHGPRARVLALVDAAARRGRSREIGGVTRGGGRAVRGGRT